jgi:copper chaperone CopZ
VKLRLLPVLISIVATSAVLFGGWFAYHSVAMETPLSETIHNIPGVEEVKMNIETDKVTLELTLASDARLHEVMAEIRENGKAIIKDRSIDLKVTNRSSADLDQWWSFMMFDIAEAMENRRYSHIPETLFARQSELSGLKIDTAMDEENVYIRLIHDDHSKFIVLPRTPAQLGVWPHE